VPPSVCGGCRSSPIVPQTIAIAGRVLSQAMLRYGPQTARGALRARNGSACPPARSHEAPCSLLQGHYKIKVVTLPNSLEEVAAASFCFVLCLCQADTPPPFCAAAPII
jgi:hypothetical protein